MKRVRSHIAKKTKNDMEGNKMSVRNEKYLKGSDIILNLKEIKVYGCNSFSSSTCSGGTGFYFDTQTKHGYMEDPDMTGSIEVIKSEKVKDGYILKVRFKQENDRF